MHPCDMMRVFVQPEQAALLRSLLLEQRVLSLAVVADDRPVIGLLPLRALSADGRALIIHLSSRLARPHAGLAEGSPFDALVHESVTGGLDPLQSGASRCAVKFARLRSTTLPAPRDRAAYLAPNFRTPSHHGAGRLRVLPPRDHRRRLVSGFGGAVNLSSRTLPSLLAFGVPS